MLLLHIVLALTSIVVSSLACLWPSNRKILLSSLLASGTLLSGTVLVIQSHAALVSACLSGVLYLSVVTLLLVTARVRSTATAN